MFGWTPEHCLGMPAMRFFALLGSARRLRAREFGQKGLAMVDAASVSLGDAKYYEQLRQYYMEQAIGPEAVARKNKRQALDPTDPKTVELISNIFETASRLN